MDTVNIFRILVFTTAAIYLVYWHFQKKEISDERGKLIHLKALEAVQKVYSALIVLLAGLYSFYTNMDSLYVIATFAIGLFVTYPISSAIYKVRI